MTEIIEAIDSWTTERYSAHDKKLWGYCELIRRTSGEGKAEQVFPMTIPCNPSSKRQQVSIDDRYSFITWIRWTQPVQYEASEEFSFGKNDARFATLPIRLVLVHKKALGENLVFDFIKNFPSKFSIDGFHHVFTEGRPSIDPDHEVIFQSELGPQNYVAYEKHRFDWNMYVLNLSIQFLECVEA